MLFADLLYIPTSCYIFNVFYSCMKVQFMEVSITLLLGSIPNSVHFQLQSRVKVIVECCASLITMAFEYPVIYIYTECKVLLTEVS